MPRKTVTMLTDDYDGKELPEDTEPTRLSMGRTTYLLYLSDDNRGKLLDALNPFIEGAETVATNSTPTRARSNGGGASDADKERNRKVRHWAIQTKHKYKNAAGEEVTLGERGRIPDAVVKAWESAGSPDIS